MNENLVGKLLEAINFSAIKHKNQRRKGDDSAYINHPIGVAYILWNEGGIRDMNVLQAAVLHDTVEDTPTTFEEIEQNFGTKIRDIVAEVTDDKNLSKEKRKQHQIEHCSHSSKEAKLVKLADKLFNLRDLVSIPPKGWNINRIQGYYVWAYKVIEGLRGTNSYLEKSLDDIFAGHFNFEGKTFSVLPKENMDNLLEAYYRDLAPLKD